jgi:hypothetical protein
MSAPSVAPASGSSDPRQKRGRASILGRILLIIVGLLLVAFIGIQLIPVQRTNPPVTTQLKWDSPQTEALSRRACMDCHSNETVWPSPI